MGILRLIAAIGLVLLAGCSKAEEDVSRYKHQYVMGDVAQYPDPYDPTEYYAISDMGKSYYLGQSGKGLGLYNVAQKLIGKEVCHNSWHKTLTLGKCIK